MALFAFCLFTISATGRLNLTEYDDGYVIMQGTIYGLPEGIHGVILHENEATDESTCANLGDHFDYPSHDHEHGNHLGDLGNIDVTFGGDTSRTHINVNIGSEQVSLGKGPTSIINRAIAIHQNKDVPQPDHDDLGPPIACCNIREEFPI